MTNPINTTADSKALKVLREEREIIRSEIASDLKLVFEFTKEGNLASAILRLGDLVTRLNKISIDIDDYVFGQVEAMLKFGEEINKLDKQKETPIMPDEALGNDQ
jgi:hypothetical protein